MSNIDWSLTKDIITIIGTIGALIIGSVGLSTWRRQLKGTAQYEVAKKAVLLTYRVRDAIQAVRSPMLYLRQEEVEAGHRLEEEQRIYNERMTHLQERWAELRTIILEARVIWGEETESRFEDIRKVIGTLGAEIGVHFWLKGAYAAPGSIVDRNPARVANNDKIVYFVSEEDDFSKTINAAVERMEGFFQKRVRG